MWTTTSLTPPKQLINLWRSLMKSLRPFNSITFFPKALHFILAFVVIFGMCLYGNLNSFNNSLITNFVLITLFLPSQNKLSSLPRTSKILTILSRTVFGTTRLSGPRLGWLMTLLTWYFRWYTDFLLLFSSSVLIKVYILVSGAYRSIRPQLEQMYASPLFTKFFSSQHGSSLLSTQTSNRWPQNGQSSIPSSPHECQDHN